MQKEGQLNQNRVLAKYWVNYHAETKAALAFNMKNESIDRTQAIYIH
jgi:hypothetical protein